MHTLSHVPLRPQVQALIIVGIVTLGFALILLGGAPLQVLGSVVLTAALALPFAYDRWDKDANRLAEPESGNQKSADNPLIVDSFKRLEGDLQPDEASMEAPVVNSFEVFHNMAQMPQGWVRVMDNQTHEHLSDALSQIQILHELGFGNRVQEQAVVLESALSHLIVPPVFTEDLRATLANLDKLKHEGDEPADSDASTTSADVPRRHQAG